MSDPVVNKDVGTEPVNTELQGATKSEWSAEKIKEMFEKDESFRKSVEPWKDSHVSQAVKTAEARVKKHYEDKIPTIIEEEVRKRYPQETEEQKRIASLEKKYQESQKSQQIAELKSAVTDYAVSRNLTKIGSRLQSVIPLLDVSKVETGTLLNILDSFAEDYTSDLEDAKRKIKGQNATQPGSGDSDTTPTTQEGWESFWKNHPGQANFIKYAPAYDAWANGLRKR